MPMSPYLQNVRRKLGNDLLLVPGAGAVVVDHRGYVLLQRRADNGLWGIPGGLMEPGEEPAQTARRETYEETGLHVHIDRLVGVYAGPSFVVTYPNGDRSAIVSILFLAHPVDADATPYPRDGEATDVQWFPPDSLPENLPERHASRIRDALSGQERAYFNQDSHSIPLSSNE